jgi:AraC-like DNA-binding protein
MLEPVLEAPWLAMPEALGVLSETLELTKSAQSAGRDAVWRAMFLSMEQPRPKPKHLTLVCFHSRAEACAATFRSRAEAPLDAGLEKALRALESALERRWTVSSLARHAGMSRAVFARKFRAVLDSSPLRYLTERRMERARQLLAQSELPLTAIAERVGYASEFAFNRAFKRHYAVPPGTYRRVWARSSDSPRMAA